LLGSLLGMAALKSHAAPLATITVQNADGTHPVRFPTLQAAADAIAHGQVCVIAGVLSQAATFTADDITIRGASKGNALAGTLKDELHDAITADGKGLLVLSGKNNKIENLELSGALASLNANGDNATSAIRYAGKDITLRNCHIHDCNEGVLGGNADNGDCLIDACQFSNCGDGTSQAHNIYIGRGTRNFVLQNSRILGSKGGHLVKTRAAQSFIQATYLASLEAPSSGRCVDAANGGIVLVQDCVLEGGTGAGTNPDFIGVAVEGASSGKQSTTVQNCILINDEPNLCGVFRTQSPEPCACNDSILVSNGEKNPMNLRLNGTGVVTSSGTRRYDTRALAGYPPYSGQLDCLPPLPLRPPERRDVQTLKQLK
jgi:hypothetical protein